MTIQYVQINLSVESTQGIPEETLVELITDMALQQSGLDKIVRSTDIFILTEEEHNEAVQNEGV